MSQKNKHIYIIPLILLIISTVHSQLLAIDFGTQYIKASVVHSGAGKAFAIVENSKSERKFLNAVIYLFNIFSSDSSIRKDSINLTHYLNELKYLKIASCFQDCW